MASLSTFTMIAVPPTPTVPARSRSTAALASKSSKIISCRKSAALIIPETKAQPVNWTVGGDAGFYPMIDLFGKKAEPVNWTAGGDAGVAPIIQFFGKKDEPVNWTAGGDAGVAPIIQFFGKKAEPVNLNEAE